jgi:hypothetical protein
MHDPTVYLNAAKSANAKYLAAKGRGESPAELAVRKGALTEARTVYAISKVLTGAPPMTPEQKGRVLALIDCAPVL